MDVTKWKNNDYITTTDLLNIQDRVLMLNSVCVNSVWASTYLPYLTMLQKLQKKAIRLII